MSDLPCLLTMYDRAELMSFTSCSLGVVVDDAADTLIGQGVEMRNDEGLRDSPVASLTEAPAQPEIIKKEEPKKPKREEIVDG